MIFELTMLSFVASVQTLTSHQMPNDEKDNADEDSWQEVNKIFY